MLRTLAILGCQRFSDFYKSHIATSFFKSTFETIWEKEESLLNNVCKNRFRNNKLDVNQWLMKDWQIVRGKLIPRSASFGKNLKVTKNFNLKIISKDKSKIVCLNNVFDGTKDDFENE